MTLTFSPGTAAGTVEAPPSKSMAHRLLIGAALAPGESRLTGIEPGEDVSATVDCLRALGADIGTYNGTVFVNGSRTLQSPPLSPLDCRESGSTLRFLVPLALSTGRNTLFTGSEALLSRPLSVFRDLCRERGCLFSQDTRSLAVKGPLRPGEFRLPGHISSQFATGMLFALPLLNGSSTLRLLPPVASAPYLDLTLRTLRDFGIAIERPEPNTFFVRGNQHYTPLAAAVEGDHSNAAFLAALNLFGGRVAVTGTDPDSLQGDKIYQQHFDSLCKGTPAIHLGDCPDLAPLLFAVAAAKYGGVFTGTARLRFKESDRGRVMAEELRKFGAAVTVGEDSVVIFPQSFHAPDQPLNAHNDHRVAMALAVLCSVTGGTLEGAEAVNKSFPSFFDKLGALGIAFRRL